MYSYDGMRIKCLSFVNNGIDRFRSPRIETASAQSAPVALEVRIYLNRIKTEFQFLMRRTLFISTRGTISGGKMNSAEK